MMVSSGNHAQHAQSVHTQRVSPPDSDPATRGKIRVFAIGSPHGDDQLGWLVARQLQSTLDQLGQHDLCEVITLTTPLQLLSYSSEDTQMWILVDACDSGQLPGTINRFRWPDRRIGSQWTSSSHGVSLPEALRLASALGRLPDRVVVWAIEIDPQRTGFQTSRDYGQVVTCLADRLVTDISEIEANRRKAGARDNS